jgi:hypothetical protein
VQGLGTLLAGTGLALVLGATAGCGLGGAGTCAPSTDVRLYYEVLDPGKAGRTSWNCRQDTLIRIDPTVPPVAVQRVIEHELGHARGLDHVEDPECVMRSPPLLSEAFCPEEIEAAIAFGGVSRVVILDDGLRDDARAAMARWNEAAGRILFVER